MFATETPYNPHNKKNVFYKKHENEILYIVSTIVIVAGLLIFALAYNYFNLGIVGIPK